MVAHPPRPQNCWFDVEPEAPAAAGSSGILSSAILLAVPACVDGTARDEDVSVDEAAGGLEPLALVLTPNVSPRRAVRRRLLRVSTSSFALWPLCSLNLRRAAMRSSREADSMRLGSRMPAMKPDRRRDARLFGGWRPDASAASGSSGGGRGPSADGRLFSPSCSFSGRRSIRLLHVRDVLERDGNTLRTIVDMFLRRSEAMGRCKQGGMSDCMARRAHLGRAQSLPYISNS